jgi:putative transcriptional regulator
VAKTNNKMRAAILETAADLHSVGIMSGERFEKVTMRLVDRDQLKKVEPLAGKDILAIREQAGLSQAVFAGHLNIAVSTLSQWERDQKKPRGAALKLLAVIQRKGLAVIL